MEAALDIKKAHLGEAGKYNTDEQHKFTPNFVKSQRQAWKYIPQLKGCKGNYLTVFFALYDEIGGNFWQPKRIARQYLIDKCKLNRRTVDGAKRWLVNHDLIRVVPGKNGYEMATYSLNVAVQFYTTTEEIEVQKRTSKRVNRGAKTHPDSGAEMHPFINNETINITKHILEQFEIFYCLYDYKKGKDKALAEWKKLRDEEREKVLQVAKDYVKATPNKQYRQSPTRYLREKTFNDEILSFNNKNNHLITPINTNEDRDPL